MTEEKIPMIPIALADLYVNAPTENNIYVKINDNKYVLLYKKGAIPSTEQLNSYKEKDIETLWIHSSEFHNFVRKNVYLAHLASGSNKLPADAKAKVFFKATDAVFKEIQYNGITEEALIETKKMAQSFFKYALSDDSVKSLIDTLNKNGDWIVRRSITVSFLSLITAMELNELAPNQLLNLSIGSLLMDVGLNELPEDLVNKSINDMSEEEFSAYKTHPILGRQMAEKNGSVPDEVLHVIHQHHERPTGQGYPLQLKKSKIHPLAQIVAVADEFADLIVYSPQRPRVLPIGLALKTYTDSDREHLNLKIVRALKDAVESKMQSESSDTKAA